MQRETGHDRLLQRYRQDDKIKDLLKKKSFLKGSLRYLFTAHFDLLS